MTLAEALREELAKADAAAGVVRGIVAPSLAGLYGLGKGAISAARGEGFVAPAVAAIEGAQDTLTRPFTEGGREKLAQMHEALGRGAQAAADMPLPSGFTVRETLAPAAERFERNAQENPALAAGSMAMLSALNPNKLGSLTRGLRGAAGSVLEGSLAGPGRAAAERGAIDLGASKAAKALREAGAADETALASAGTQPADVALRGFGEAKVKREAATAKRLEQQQASTDVVERQKGAGERVKQEPDVYRQMYEQQGPEAVLQAAQAGEHLKPQPGGGWVGAPRTVQTGPQLGAMRKSLDEQFNRGVDALTYADPERVGTWYDRAKAAQAEIHEPHQLERGLDQHAVYSAGVSPESELAFALKHHNSRALGTDERAYRGAGAETLDERDALRALESTTPQDIPPLAPKIGEYRNKNDPRLPEKGPFGVNDFRMAQAYSYTDPAGNPWKAGVSDTMHPFMDAETALAGQRATERGALGGKPVTGGILQEIPWVLNKAEDIYGRGKNARFAGGQEGMVKALREANNTIADYLPKHAMSSTYEYAPGANTGHMPQVLDMPYAEREAYGHTGRWDTPTPMDAKAGGMPESVGAGNRDAIYRALDFKQQPTRAGEGMYTNSLGQVENNPMGMARPLVDFQTAPEGSGIQPNTINPHTLQTLRAAERFRGLNDAQEAVAGNLPVTMESRGGKSGMLLERDTLPSAEELANVQSVLEGTGLSAAPTNRGMNIINTEFDDPKKRRYFSDYGRSMADIMREAFPGSTATPAANEGFYIGGVTTPERHAGKGVATARALREWAAAPPEAARNVSESAEVRKLIRQKLERDAALGGARPDIQATREFFNKADWNRVVEMMRQGMKPAAAMGALGYSLKGMAAEQPER